MTPNFLVIGAARSGTTGLAEGLRTHSEVFLTNPKEPHYFALHGERPRFTGPGDERFVNQAAVTDWAAYTALFDKSEGAKAVGDASVSTLYYHQKAIPEIQRRLDDPRLLVMLREPAGRAFSAYEYLRGLGLETAPTFEAALAAEDERKASGWHHMWHYRSMSLYAEAVNAFIEAFGPDRVRVLFHDDLEADYAGTVAAALDFLGVESSGTTRTIRVNGGGSSRSPLISKVLDGARGIEPLRRAVRAATPYHLREKVRQSLLERAELDRDDAADLGTGFRDDLRRLSAILPPAGQPAWLEGAR